MDIKKDWTIDEQLDYLEDDIDETLDLLSQVVTEKELLDIEHRIRLRFGLYLKPNVEKYKRK